MRVGKNETEKGATVARKRTDEMGEVGLQLPGFDETRRGVFT